MREEATFGRASNLGSVLCTIRSYFWFVWRRVWFRVGLRLVRCFFGIRVCFGGLSRRIWDSFSIISVRFEWALFELELDSVNGSVCVWFDCSGFNLW